MGLDVWFPEDAVRVLEAVYEAAASSWDAARATGSEPLLAYQQGFLDALRAVALGFGLDPAGGASARSHRPSASGPCAPARRQLRLPPGKE